ncbi:SDR family NAD(P)-dependent oxidoreductase [Umezawaea sp. NPDC059074]|uniref:SDR family NAD(P)-dependent oxidoreductase n=1 Tax=Umezawaea sp. NPDC059074 TaxID=3346716 RepID=UPI00367F4211
MSGALVTGGARGVGAAVARALAGAGLRVAVHARADVAAAEAVVKALPGDGHAVVSGDLADPEAVAAFVAEAVAALGDVDVLVNNAGIYTEHPLPTTSYAEWIAEWRRTTDVNVLGVANTTWCFVDHLRARSRGPEGARIITVGSRGAYRGEPTAPAYGASKAAVHSLTQSLAVSLAPLGVAVTAVAPGFVDTDMTSDILAGERGDAIRAQSPFNRVATPDDVASAVAWLATPGAGWASGAVIDLNGASHLR